uniref:ANK_REP_REGION domain-containing protein n=1 Tax=Macrostomum lignano TaxID=282301 RepID=A0A1I8FKH3_9PLAT
QSNSEAAASSSSFPSRPRASNSTVPSKRRSGGGGGAVSHRRGAGRSVEAADAVVSGVGVAFVVAPSLGCRCRLRQERSCIQRGIRDRGAATNGRVGFELRPCSSSSNDCSQFGRVQHDWLEQAAQQPEPRKTAAPGPANQQRRSSNIWLYKPIRAKWTRLTGCVFSPLWRLVLRLSGVGNAPPPSSAGSGAVGAAFWLCGCRRSTRVARQENFRASYVLRGGLTLFIRARVTGPTCTCKIGYLMKRSEGKVKRVWQKRRRHRRRRQIPAYHDRPDESKPPVSPIAAHAVRCDNRREDRSKRAFRLISKQQLMDTRKIFIRAKYVDRCYVFHTVETSSDSPDSVGGLQSLKSDLLKAVRHQNMPLLLQAFAEGCDLLAQYSNGETAVHILLREGDESICLAIVDFILQNSPASALKRATVSTGETLLHYCVNYNRPDCLKLCLRTSLSASAVARNHAGLTAADICEQLSFPICAD